jgi:hypothetical protein
VPVGGKFKMGMFAKNDHITFTGEAEFGLDGIGGVIFRRKISNGHYLYDVELSVRPAMLNITLFRISGKLVVKNIPGDWMELR